MAKKEEKALNEEVNKVEVHTKEPLKVDVNVSLFKKKDKKNTKRKVNKVWLVVGGIVLIVVIFLSVVAYLMYGKKDESNFVQGVSRVIPYPAVMADGKYVTMSSYYDQLDILKTYYKEFKKTDFGSEDGKKKLADIRKEVMIRLTEDAIVMAEAKKMGVSVAKKELDESFDKLVTSNGGIKDFSEVLKKYYGLTPDEFKTSIYEPRLLRQKLTDKINGDESVTGAAKKKADDLLAQVKAGADFAKLAKENSQDQASAVNGGDLGYFGKGKMVPEFEKAAFELKVGEVSSVIRTVYGFHIIKVTDKKDDQVKASHILIKVRDFNEWLADMKKSVKVWQPLKV